jgi:transcription elongation factor GreA
MPQYLTKDGLEKLKKELEEIKQVKMPEVIERIARARELGDLAENAEYQDAKETQGFMAGRIAEIEYMINKSTVIEEGSAGGVVSIGSTVTVQCDGKTMTYTIVGSNEADPSKGLISNESPIAKAFLGKKKGEPAVIQAPRGPMECVIMKIQ